jgi:predicted transcriptional regulator
VSPSVLMSIRPRFAEAILCGDKSVELRRRRPSFSAGTKVLVYASSPVRRVIGWFEVGDVITASPRELWVQVKDCAGVSRQEFDDYFVGCDVAYALVVTASSRLAPAPLRIRPPQSWQYLRTDERSHRALMRRVEPQGPRVSSLSPSTI